MAKRLSEGLDPKKVMAAIVKAMEPLTPGQHMTIPQLVTDTGIPKNALEAFVVLSVGEGRNWRLSHRGTVKLLRRI